MAALSERVRQLFDRAASAGSLEGVIFQGIGASLFAVGAVIAEGVLTVGDVFILPLQALANALADLTIAIFGSPARVIIAGTVSTVESLTTGRFDVGPFTLPLAVGIVLLTLWLVLAFRSEEETSNFIPGLGADIPTPGVTDPEEEDED